MVRCRGGEALAIVEGRDGRKSRPRSYVCGACALIGGQGKPSRERTHRLPLKARQWSSTWSMYSFPTSVVGG